MNKIVKIALIILSFIIHISCTKDFISKDISNDKISIVAPSDGLNTPNNLITFWWNELDGAETYNLQIVKPTFNAISQLLVDTVITDNKFNYTFTPGTYQWRIKGTNGGGSTAFATRTLYIDTTSNLNLTSVALGTPGSKFVTSTNAVNFSWTALPAANYYELQITPLSGSGMVITVPNLTSTNYLYTFTTTANNEEKFKWSVIARNSFSQTQNNSVRSLRIDHKTPSNPLLTYPGDYDQAVKDSSSFRWNYGIVKADIEYDILYIGFYPDSTLTNPTIIQPIARLNTGSSSYSISPNLTFPLSTSPASNYYWWKVESVDSVGNVSPASAIRRFRLKG